MIYVVSLIIAGCVLALDLITKSLAVSNNVDLVIIPELLKFKLSYNTGGAFSLLGDEEWAMTFFIILTIVVLLAIIGFFVFTLIKKNKISKWLAVSLALSFAGALGNMIDRIMLGKVRDFIYVFYNTRIFPAIFNVADMALVIGLIMIIIFVLFLDKEAVFKKPQREEEQNAENND